MASNIDIAETIIEGVKVITTQSLEDNRGTFQRFYCDNQFSEILNNRYVAQINFSYTKNKGVVRGMHFQFPPQAEMKFVRCVRGRVWDVAVDLRRSSSTLLRWHATELSPQNNRVLVIPEGCAHGFQTLEPGTELLYLHTKHYSPEAEGGIRYDDPLIDIKWPCPVIELSTRDIELPFLTKNFSGIQL